MSGSRGAELKLSLARLILPLLPSLAFLVDHRSSLACSFDNIMEMDEHVGVNGKNYDVRESSVTKPGLTPYQEILRDPEFEGWACGWGKAI